MKNIIAASILMFPKLCFCQQIKSESYVITTKVLDENQRGIFGAKVTASQDELVAQAAIPQSKPVRVNVMTDQDGVAVTNLSSVHPPTGILVEKDGFYPSTSKLDIERGDAGDNSHMARIEVVLKSVKNPIAMYAKDSRGDRAGYVRIPRLDTDFGYDLMLGRALPPLGDGRVADFYFRVEGEYNDRNSNSLKLIVRCSNASDGFIEFLPPRQHEMSGSQIGSLFISDYQAPDSGYVSVINRSCSVSGGGMERESDVDQRRNFYFRVRTSVDSSGRIVKANYGKIYGDFDFSSGNLKKGTYANIGIHTSYFNPESNDRNVEFDPKRNLLIDGNVDRP